MSDEYREKLRSLTLRHSKTPSKTTVDVHDNHTVEVTESDERQDVLIKPATIALKTTMEG